MSSRRWAIAEVERFTSVSARRKFTRWCGVEPGRLNCERNALPETLQAPSLVSGAAAAPRAASSVADTGEQLRELARLRDEKVITPEEYERKRSELAGKL